MESTTLADWVGDVRSFTGHQWQRKPAVFTPEELAPPFDLDALDAAFDTGLLRTPYLEMVRSTKVTVPPEAYTTSRVVNGTTYHGFADRAKVLALLGAGATLLLRCVDQWHRPTGELVARLSEELDRRVEAFFFVTPAGGQGLAVHRDDADVFVLQAAGRKTWYVHDAPTVAHWSPGELPDDEHSRGSCTASSNPAACSTSRAASRTARSAPPASPPTSPSRSATSPCRTCGPPWSSGWRTGWTSRRARWARPRSTTPAPRCSTTSGRGST